MKFFLSMLLSLSLVSSYAFGAESGRDSRGHQHDSSLSSSAHGAVVGGTDRVSSAPSDRMAGIKRLFNHVPSFLKNNSALDIVRGLAGGVAVKYVTKGKSSSDLRSNSKDFNRSLLVGALALFNVLFTYEEVTKFDRDPTDGSAINHRKEYSFTGLVPNGYGIPFLDNPTGSISRALASVAGYSLTGMVTE